MESWQKLISVLTHEIMNSLTPIITLAASSNSLLQEKRQSLQIVFDHETHNDLQSALS